MEFVLQMTVVLFCLLYGTYKGSIGLGLSSGTGVLFLVFVFGLSPGKPPIEIMLVIIAVVVASATLQASGGLNILLNISEKILRYNPKIISLIAPLITCILSMLCGTGHIVYALLPIIYDISIKSNVRPERPMAASSVGSQMGIIASPVSVATVSLAAMLNLPDKHGIDFLTLLSITIPATLCGILMIGLFSYFRGKELKDDIDFLSFIHQKNNYDYVYHAPKMLIDKILINKKHWMAIGIFIITIVIIILCGAIPELRPGIGLQKISMTCIIQLCMLCCGTVMILLTNINPDKISHSEIFRSGMIAIITIYGTAWMTNTLFINHQSYIENTIACIIQAYPWTYILILLILSQLINSQAITLATVVPIALAIGINPAIIIATAPACYGYYILPTYPTDLATTQFDRSGTTKIGSWIINHSFLPIGLLGVTVSCLVGWLLINNIYNLI